MTIKEYFVEVIEDKFTNSKISNSKQKLVWEGEFLRNKFILSKKDSLHRLEITTTCINTNNEDTIFFMFLYSNVDDGYLDMEKLKMYLMLDDTITIELNEVSNIEKITESYEVNDKYGNIYLSQAILNMSKSDLIKIVKANKIDYSIRIGGKIDGSLTLSQISSLKGFYNAVFDSNFESDKLLHFLNSQTNITKKESKNDGGCYIATMVYGSYEHSQVLLLRKFRDNYLEKRRWGRFFISMYYQYSPQIVQKFKNSFLFNRIVRKLLDLFIHLINK